MPMLWVLFVAEGTAALGGSQVDARACFPSDITGTCGRNAHFLASIRSS